MPNTVPPPTRQESDKKRNYASTVTVDDIFEPENHWYPKVVNAQLASQVSSFISMGNERIISRYCHLHPQVDSSRLREILSYEPKFFCWSGADLFNVTSMNGERKMILIETNSCPSGMKSMPTLQDNDEYGSYRVLIEKTFKPLVERSEKEGRIPADGRLAVVYDKNEMECTGYAHTIASVFEEDVLLVQYHHTDVEPCVRFNEDGIMEVQDEESKWHKVRAAFRYLTQKPWTRLPISSKTLILNPPIACLSGGRNKLIAAKAYEIFNSENSAYNLEIMVPKTIRDVELNLVPLYVKSFGGFAVIKNPYSNAGQGVWTITSEKELEDFMAQAEAEQQYDQFIVQSLIGNSKWSSSHHASGLQYFHVGSVPDKKREIFVADLRMMIHYNCERKGFAPLALYARRAKNPLADDPAGKNSWDMLGTNLSVKTGQNSWDTETKRLIIMDRREFNRLGLGLDDLIDGYIQTVMATVAIDKIARRLSSEPGKMDMELFASLNNDQSLIQEIML